MQIPKLKIADPVLVTWDDAFVATPSYWFERKELEQIRPVKTLGYFLKQTDRFFTISQTLSPGLKHEHDGYGGGFSIPIGCIRSVKKIRS